MDLSDYAGWKKRTNDFQHQTGAISINSYPSIDIALPFGGYKQSGIGFEKSIHVIENTQL